MTFPLIWTFSLSTHSGENIENMLQPLQKPDGPQPVRSRTSDHLPCNPHAVTTCAHQEMEVLWAHVQLLPDIDPQNYLQGLHDVCPDELRGKSCRA
jgi:hypothetical protein